MGGDNTNEKSCSDRQCFASDCWFIKSTDRIITNQR